MRRLGRLASSSGHFRTAREQSGIRKIVTGYVLPDFVEGCFGRAQADGHAQPQRAELVRKDADQIEIAPRTLRIDGTVSHLDFAGSVGESAIFFVSGGGGKNHVRALGGLGEEHVVHDEQIESGDFIRVGSGEGLQGIRADYVKCFQFSSQCRFDHRGGGETGRIRNFAAPGFGESRALAGIGEWRVAG